MATHSSILAWIISWTEEPGGLQSMGLQSRTQLSDFHFHMVLNVNWTDCGDRTAAYTNTESLCCTPEMNIMLSVIPQL